MLPVRALMHGAVAVINACLVLAGGLLEVKAVTQALKAGDAPALKHLHHALCGKAGAEKGRHASGCA